jgi:aryl-alcohol dehydrogenase-like predicted oxidoreductase
MRLALGTAQLGMEYGVANSEGKKSIDEVREILDEAKLSGVDTLDTAISYGDSEKILGSIGVNDWRITSKLPAIQFNLENISGDVEKMFQNSLKTLRIEKMYGFILHHPKQLASRDGELIYRTLADLKQQGLIEKIGVSIYSPMTLNELVPHYDFDIVQAPFNILDQRILYSGWMARLYSMNVELHVRSIFLQGLLLMNSKDRPDYFSHWDKLWRLLEEWLREAKLMPLDACVRFIVQFEKINQFIVGVDNKEQLAQIILASKMPPLKVPDYLISDDEDLINPSNWKLEKSRN